MFKELLRKLTADYTEEEYIAYLCEEPVISDPEADCEISDIEED